MSIHKCIALLKYGVNKNNVCNRNAKNGYYCGIHKKLNQINENNILNNISNSMNKLNLNSVSNSDSNSDNTSLINVNHEIYIVQLSEHIRCKDNIYKVGMTKKGINNRIKGYPKNTQILFSIIVKNAKLCEREVIKQCRSTNGITNCNRHHPDKIKQLGNEYFEGDYNLLKNTVEMTCKKFNQQFNQQFNQIL